MNLTEIRTAQHDDQPTPADAAFRAFLLACDPGAVALDRASHASAIELRMIGASA